MKSILTSCLLLIAMSAFAATPKDVTYKSGDETVRGIVYTPEGKGPFPALIVIHEWWGLNAWVKEHASKLADQGYVTLAVDLYRGKVATTPNEAHEFMGGVPRQRAARDLQAAFQYLESQASVRKERIGAIGWCMGGGYAVGLAIEQPGLAADVVNYGVFDYASLARDQVSMKQINAPILGLFGQNDRGIPSEDLKQFRAAMEKLGKKVEITIYPDAGHAFENPNNKDGYREKDAADAWNKTVAFLEQTLKK